MKTRERGSLYKQQRSSYWWVRIGFRGRLICQSTKTADKRQALEMLKAKRRELEIHLDAGLRRATWTAPGRAATWRCRSPGTRPRRCTGATTS